MGSALLTFARLLLLYFRLYQTYDRGGVSICVFYKVNFCLSVNISINNISIYLSNTFLWCPFWPTNPVFTNSNYSFLFYKLWKIAHSSVKISKFKSLCAIYSKLGKKIKEFKSVHLKIQKHLVQRIYLACILEHWALMHIVSRKKLFKYEYVDYMCIPLFSSW